MKIRIFFITIALFYSSLLFAERNIGLCLSGGGAKGAYEAGVWAYMQEKGLTKNIKAISGTSIGGINAVLFTCLNKSDVETFWRDEIGPTTILTPDYAKFLLIKNGIQNFIKDINETYKEYKEDSPDAKLSPYAKTLMAECLDVILNFFDSAYTFALTNEKSYGFFSREGLINLINYHIPYEKLYEPVTPDIYISVIKKDNIALKCLSSQGSNINNTHVFKLQEQNSENIAAILCATSAVPIAFDSVTLPVNIIENGEEIGAAAEYVDGGFDQAGGRNVNIVPLVNDKEVKTIIAVFLKSRSQMSLSAKHQEELNKIIVLENQERSAWEAKIAVHKKAMNMKIKENNAEKDSYLERLKFRYESDKESLDRDREGDIYNLKAYKERLKKEHTNNGNQGIKEIEKKNKEIKKYYDYQKKTLHDNYKNSKKQIEYETTRINEEVKTHYIRIINQYPEPQLHYKERNILENKWKYDEEYERQDILNVKKEARGKKVIFIIPEKNMGNMLTGTANFTYTKMNELINLGYEDAKAALASEKKLLNSTSRKYLFYDFGEF